MSDKTRIEIKLEGSEFMAHGTREFVSEMFTAYIRAFRECYGHYPLLSEDVTSNVETLANVIQMKDVGKDK